ncbi:lambda-exonuclease family protein [Candidatus Phytoplasma fraxini]|uniref:YqaJ viral recombinase n=1 Tax=Ash yellows phytoplasma TaxID=35780 RepID=A0ABZ2U7X3_ASHYP
MGLNPYETQEDLIKKKLFGSSFISNEAVEHGKKNEPKANLFFCIKMKRNYEPTVFTKDIFSSSLDGYHKASKTMLEIKCPLKKDGPSWKVFCKDGIIPPYYWAQVQCGLYYADIKKAYFLVYINDKDYICQEILADETFIKNMINIYAVYQKKLNGYREQMKK